MFIIIIIITNFRERKGESKTSIGCLHTHPSWGSNQNPRIKAKPPGMCSDGESNPQPFGVPTTLQPTEPLLPAQKVAYQSYPKFTAPGGIQYLIQPYGESLYNVNNHP